MTKATYLLWYINDPTKSFADALKEGVKRYKSRLERSPNLVEISPELFTQEFGKKRKAMVGDIRVRSHPQIQPKLLHIGMENGKTT